VTISPLSDFALHNMGTGLQDQVNQGAANGQQFRTAPLWGVGQRVFFLHGGRTNNLVTAIQAHARLGSQSGDQQFQPAFAIGSAGDHRLPAFALTLFPVGAAGGYADCRAVERRFRWRMAIRKSRKGSSE